MRKTSYLLTLAMGTALGIGISLGFLTAPKPLAAANDRHDNYIMCTGMAGVNPRSPMDGVWLLDYKQGKLLATIVDRTVGKITGFAEMDLTNEFGIGSNLNLNFLMTTGTITGGQSALYLVETTSGKIGVYTMGPTTNGTAGVTIMRHDVTSFRKAG
jgi:hypothetical protein